MSFIVQDKVIERGERVKDFIKIGKGSTHEVKLPYIIFNGREAGPVLTILGGVHGIECAPVEAIYRLAENLSPERIKGTLIMVPIVNTEGFHARKSYHNQLDHLNQNQVFPGDPEATITRRVAYHVFDHFVSKSDVLVDAHSADLGEDVYGGIFVYETEDKELYERMVELASLYNPVLIESTGISGNTGEAVKEYGIPCLMIESGTPYPIREKDVEYHYDGAINLLRYLGMIDGEAASYDPPVNPSSQRIWAEKGGVWRRYVEAGQRVKRGEKLGRVCNLLGEIIQEEKAPFDGVVSFLRIHYSVNAGDSLLWLARV